MIGSQAGPEVKSHQSQVGLGEWKQRPHAGPGRLSQRSQAGLGGWDNGSQAEPRMVQAGYGFQTGTGFGSQAGPWVEVDGCYGAGVAGQIIGPHTTPSHWAGRSRNSTTNLSLSPSLVTSWSEPVYCHGCSNWGALTPMIAPAG